MLVQSWAEVTFDSLKNTWGILISFLPALIGALIILVIGLVVAAGLRSLVERLLDALKVDSALKGLGLGTYFERAGLSVNAGKFFGLVVYWFLIVVFVLAAADALNLFGVSLFLRDIVSYVPNIIVAILIMLSALLLANFLRSLIQASVTSARLHNPKFLGALTWWTIVVFGFFATLIQLGIAADLLRFLALGIIAMFTLAGGIAFGLGGKDYAAHLLEKFREATEER